MSAIPGMFIRSSSGHKEQRKTFLAVEVRVLQICQIPKLKGLGKTNRDYLIIRQVYYYLMINKLKNTLECTNQDLVPPWTLTSFTSLRFGQEGNEPFAEAKPLA